MPFPRDSNRGYWPDVLLQRCAARQPPARIVEGQSCDARQPTVPQPKQCSWMSGIGIGEGEGNVLLEDGREAFAGHAREWKIRNRGPIHDFQANELTGQRKAPT